MLTRNLQARAASATFLALSARPDSDQRSMRASWPDRRQSIDPPQTPEPARCARRRLHGHQTIAAARRDCAGSSAVGQCRKLARVDVWQNRGARLRVKVAKRARRVSAVASVVQDLRAVRPDNRGRHRRPCPAASRRHAPFLGSVELATALPFVSFQCQATGRDRGARQVSGAARSARALARTGGAVSFRQRRDPS